jgi:hypothetical protein
MPDPEPATGPATSADADRIAALIGRLTPLADAATGELIKAQDWNVLAGAVIEIARAVLSQPAGVVPAHNHADQVAVGWLDDNLRGLVSRGPLSDPAVESRVGGIERQLALLAGRIEALAGRLDDAGRRLSSVATNDLVRANDVAVVRRGIDSLGDAKLDVVKLRASLSDLQVGVATAVEAGRALTINGQVADLTALNDRLSAVEALKNQLTLPTGQFFDPQLLDQRLTNLQDNLVSKDELATALHDHSAVLSPGQLSELRAGAGSDAVAAVTPSITAATEALRAEMSTQLAGVDAKVSKAVGDGQAATVSAALAAIRPELTAAVSQTRTDLSATIDQQVRAAGTGLRTELGGRIDAVNAGLGAQITGEVGHQLGNRLDSLTANLNSLSTRLDQTEVRIKDRDVTFGQLSAQVAQNARDDAAGRDALKAAVTSDLDRRDQINATTLATQLDRLQAANQQQVGIAVRDSQQSISAQMQAIATAAAASQVQTAVSGLRTELGRTQRIIPIAEQPG